MNKADACRRDVSIKKWNVKDFREIISDEILHE